VTFDPHADRLQLEDQILIRDLHHACEVLDPNLSHTLLCAPWPTPRTCRLLNGSPPPWGTLPRSPSTKRASGFLAPVRLRRPRCFRRARLRIVAARRGRSLRLALLERSRQGGHEVLVPHRRGG